jgi:hypothetical protein
MASKSDIVNFMSTQKETIDFILEKLHDSKRFKARAMFGEYALYADKKVVALVCDDLLYVKIFPASHELEDICEKGEPYPRAKLCYVVEEGQLSTIENLPSILFGIAEAIPTKKKKLKRIKRKSII